MKKNKLPVILVDTLFGKIRFIEANFVPKDEIWILGNPSNPKTCGKIIGVKNEINHSHK